MSIPDATLPNRQPAAWDGAVYPREPKPISAAMRWKSRCASSWKADTYPRYSLKVQKAVKEAVERDTGCQVDAVHILIAGIVFPADKEAGQ